MTPERRKEIEGRAIRTYGEQPQVDVAIENTVVQKIKTKMKLNTWKTILLKKLPTYRLCLTKCG